MDDATIYKILDFYQIISTYFTLLNWHI
jgi:hypothetical protein